MWNRACIEPLENCLYGVLPFYDFAVFMPTGHAASDSKNMFAAREECYKFIFCGSCQKQTYSRVEYRSYCTAKGAGKKIIVAYTTDHPYFYLAQDQTMSRIIELKLFN